MNIKFIKQCYNKEEEDSSDEDKPSFKEVQIYTFKLPDGKFYVTYTIKGLDSLLKIYKSCTVFPLYHYLNDENIEVIPIYEKTVYADIHGDEINKELRKILNKYTNNPTQILNENLQLLGYPNKISFYSYIFSDGKIYVGFIKNSNLFYRHMQHKQRPISPIHKYLNSTEDENVIPKIEKTLFMTENEFSKERYNIIRKIFDKYTTDTTKILNVNLYLYGY